MTQGEEYVRVAVQQVKRLSERGALVLFNNKSYWVLRTQVRDEIHPTEGPAVLYVTRWGLEQAGIVRPTMPRRKPQ